ncbi:hypothetical protein VF21_07889 [Pseudogymnoascus sp. 05NY08]|nr:hypothetical protein VF21_07889 [Pseudogymnoascus sp. 05NY08]
MNEMTFQNHNKLPAYYHTFEEQNVTRLFQGERETISMNSPTYIHFTVNLEPHWAAVQITITPFTVRTIPGQTFYTSKYRYTLCCDLANPTAISQIVQQTYDNSYRPTQWNFSEESCCTIDPIVAIGDCEAAIASKLCQYKGSTAQTQIIDVIEVSDIEDGSTHSRRKRRRGPSSNQIEDAAYASIRQKYIRCSSNFDDGSGEAGITGDHDTGDEDIGDEDTGDDDTGDEDTGDKDTGDKDTGDDDTGNTGDEGTGDDDTGNIGDDYTGDDDGRVDDEGNEDVGDADGESDDTGVDDARKIANKIRIGIEKISKTLPVDAVDIQLPVGQESPEGLAIYYETRLWAAASKTSKTAKEKIWMFRFLASCFALVRKKIGSGERRSKSGVGSIRTADRWISVAGMLNLIVNELSSYWGWKADLVYHALAAKNYSLGNCGRFSKAKQEKIISYVVKELHDYQFPPSVETYPIMFHPALLISKSLHLKYSLACEFLGLDFYAKAQAQSGTSIMPVIYMQAGRQIISSWHQLDSQAATQQLLQMPQDVEEDAEARDSLDTLIAAAVQVEMPTHTPKASTAVPSVLPSPASGNMWVPLKIMQQSLPEERWNSDYQSRLEDIPIDDSNQRDYVDPLASFASEVSSVNFNEHLEQVQLHQQQQSIPSYIGPLTSFAGGISSANLNEQLHQQETQQQQQQQCVPNYMDPLASFNGEAASVNFNEHLEQVQLHQRDAQQQQQQQCVPNYMDPMASFNGEAASINFNEHLEQVQLHQRDAQQQQQQQCVPNYMDPLASFNGEAASINFNEHLEQVELHQRDAQQQFIPNQMDRRAPSTGDEVDNNTTIRQVNLPEQVEQVQLRDIQELFQASFAGEEDESVNINEHLEQVQLQQQDLQQPFSQYHEPIHC